MSDTTDKGYGWQSSVVPASQMYLYEHIVKRVEDLGADKVVDLGSGNGYL